MSFFYYLPGPPQDVLRGELSYAFERQPNQRNCTGPDKQSGYVYTTAEKAGYYPEDQQWVEADGFWVGFDATTPKQLERKKMLTGRAVELAGHQWQIPIARSFDETGPAWVDRLERYFRYDPKEGKWEWGDVVREYRHVWDNAWRWWELWYHENSKAEHAENEHYQAPEPMGEQELQELAASMLSVNYRVGPLEISLLELLTTSTMRQILDAAADIQAFLSFALAEDAKKKTLADEPSNTDSGPTESSEATPRLLQTG